MNKNRTSTQSVTRQSIIEEGLSVVIPTYNGSSWLPETVKHIERALAKASVRRCEIVVVNDGSTDDTTDVVEKLINSSRYPVRLVNQNNSGRFIARETGTNEAKFPNLLFVDTRVYIGEDSLNYVVGQQQKDDTRRVWCSHVRVDKKGNIYARFWETVAFVAWRKYFKNPKDTSYGIEHFDDYPKGTTCFFITKSILHEANAWFKKNTKDLKTSNDDTLLLRHIARKNSINISPDFWCLYHARSTLKQYSKHVIHRGKVFVDGFLRNDGNRFFIPLILFLALSLVAVIVMVLRPEIILPLLVIGAIGWLLELAIMLLLGVPYEDALATFVLSPIFALCYGAGIWFAFTRIYVIERIRLLLKYA